MFVRLESSIKGLQINPFTDAQMVSVVIAFEDILAAGPSRTQIEAEWPEVQNLRTVNVLAHPPRSREEWLEWNTQWPIHFRPHPGSACLPANSSDVLDEEMPQLASFIKIAQEQAEMASKAGHVPIGAVICGQGRVLSQAFDGRCHRKATVSMCLVSGGDKNAISSGAAHPLHHAAIECIKKEAEREVQNGNFRVHSTKRPKIDNELPKVDYVSQAPDNIQSLPYLCTGLDMVITHEPCILCAMALLHSRIRRVFFLHANKKSGGFSRYLLHTRKALNHRFSVFQMVPDGDD